MAIRQRRQKDIVYMQFICWNYLSDLCEGIEDEPYAWIIELDDEHNIAQQITPENRMCPSCGAEAEDGEILHDTLQEQGVIGGSYGTHTPKYQPQVATASQQFSEAGSRQRGFGLARQSAPRRLLTPSKIIHTGTSYEQQIVSIIERTLQVVPLTIRGQYLHLEVYSGEQIAGVASRYVSYDGIEQAHLAVASDKPDWCMANVVQHELGHIVDGLGGRHNSVHNPAWVRWRQAAAATQNRVDTAFDSYVNKPEEIWARAFAQLLGEQMGLLSDDEKRRIDDDIRRRIRQMDRFTETQIQGYSYSWWGDDWQELRHYTQDILQRHLFQ